MKCEVKSNFRLGAAIDPGGPWHLSSLVQWVLRHWLLVDVSHFQIELCCSVLEERVNISLHDIYTRSNSRLHDTMFRLSSS